MGDSPHEPSKTEYESELTASRTDVAAVLSGVADGVLAGTIRVGQGAEAVSVDVAEEIDLEIELEAEDDAWNLELELEWPAAADDPTASAGEIPMDDANEPSDAPSTDIGPGGTDEAADLVAAADATESLARFEVFADRADEWRWRLRHRNGNVIATSGEGYTRKANAQKGLRSVVANSPAAEVIEESSD